VPRSSTAVQPAAHPAAHRAAPPGAPEQPVLVCGLGALGQAVLARLLPFAIPLRLLALEPPDWRSPALQQALADAVVLGDMRRPHVLRQVDGEHARAVLLLGSDSSANFEAALQVRVLNPHAEIVVRSSSELDHLGTLLEQRLPALTVVDPVQLTAGALVQALRPGQRVARFDVDGEGFEVFQGSLDDRRFQRPLRLDQGPDGLLVAPVSFHSRQASQLPAVAAPAALRRWWGLPPLIQRLGRWGVRRSRLQWALLAASLALLPLGVALFSRPGGWVQGVFVTLALLKGEYVDPANLVIRHPPGSVDGDGWLVAATLVYSLLGTLLTSALVAVILDQLLSARFGLRRRRPLRRAAAPILLVGGGALAARVAVQLRHERHAVVRVEADPAGQDDGASVLFTSLDRALAALVEVPVRAVAVLSGNLLEDLRHTLQLQAIWPQGRFAMLARSEGAGERLGALLGGAALVSPIELGADVVVATAFGERVEAVGRLADCTVLQVRYRVVAGDTICGLTVTRLEHGYGFTALALRRPRSGESLAPPPPEAVLAEGDQLVVLATLQALRRVERGALHPPGSCLHWEAPAPLAADLRFAMQQSLARYLGISPADAAALLRQGSGAGVPIDADCGSLLVRDLRRQGVQARLDAMAST